MDDMQGAPCFRVSEKDKVKIPDISMSSGSPSFCFSNQDDLPQELMRSSSTEQTIFIGGYYERHVPKEATSETLLVKILKN